ncbi:deoxyribodipyrimidine photolyase [Halobacteriales archaeon SW_7_71_33]|nr:MAG: deoxyribodipyrimidine photolyase [Halobacteriales archaeon SW_7_71_33]
MDDTGTSATGAAVDADGSAAPGASEIPRPAAVAAADEPSGYVVWHRKHLRLDDHRALTRAVAEGDAVCPLFVFDPSFYGAEALACDARVRFLHEAVASLDRLYAAVPSPAVSVTAPASRDRLAATTPLTPRSVEDDDAGTADGGPLATAADPGLTVGFGDPVAVLSAFVERGWRVLTAATPTSRYGKRRDDRVRSRLGDAVTFLSGDGLVRDRERSRTDWQDRVESWLAADQHAPDWAETTRLAVETGVTPRAVDDAYDVTPAKRTVPTGTHRAATRRLAEFVDRIEAYPGNISAPGDARDGTSGLSPYLNFGLLSVRQVHQHVHDRAPDCRGRRMFTSRLVWNMHYNQKLVDWPGWTERAVNPVYEGFNEDRHDPRLVEAWKRGETGYPMVDASMRCLRETGWLNFRMRAMAASFFAHVLQQPWWVGADWYHHHLIDSDVGINYTQWQSQAGLIGKPAQRVYNPRKQVRDHDPDGEWITEYVPELAGLPPEFLDRPERTPLDVQEDCGVVVGEDYPLPVVDFETRREAFWSRYERLHPDAADELARPEVAKRASFSGGYAAARAIADEHGRDAVDDGTQVSLTEVADGDAPGVELPARSDAATKPAVEPDSDADATVPRGAGERAGEPSPDDRAAVPTAEDGKEAADDRDDTESAGDQSSIGAFE